METIIVNNPSSTNHQLQTVEQKDYFNQFVDSQKIPSKKQGITAQGAAILREETCDILSHCNPHNATDSTETTHLVVGYVQSGKTMSFTALTALASDNGYRVVIFLAGTKNNLLDQTSKRLEKDLINNQQDNINHYKIHSNPKPSDVDDIAGHIDSSQKPIILIPVLKQYQHIDDLTDMVSKFEFKEAMQGETVLIIDDEADQASLNSYGRKNSKKNDNEEKQVSSTYDSILRLRAALPGNTYIQYTATPQANILISMQDLLSPKSHTLLTPGEGYTGGKAFFREMFGGGLVLEIPQNEVFHKKKNPLTKMPQSLRNALMYHILAVAIVVEYLQVEDINYLSMMVHPDNTKPWNKKFKTWIDNVLKSWQKALKKPDGHEDKELLYEKFERIFPHAVEYYDTAERPTFEQIKPLIRDVVNDKKVYLVNTDKDAQTEIPWNNYKMHILVGAEMLNRGFTVEKLATTYMPRYTTSATNADTIQQRCRFFGYKMDYIKSCRVFLPQDSIANYCAYIEHEEELRSTLRSCDSLAAAERKILLSSRLKPTRQNVLPISVVNTKLKGMNVTQAFTTNELIYSNTQFVQNFIEQHKDKFDISYKYNTEYRTHRGFKMTVDEAIDFLDRFRFGNFQDSMRKASTIRYIRYLAGDKKIQYVYFIQMAYTAQPIIRKFDYGKRKIATELFAGPSSEVDSTNYPGDRKIVGDDSITIQLYHLGFENRPLDFPEHAYTLAINYPESLAANYCSNEQHNQLDDDDDDNED
ncbi:MAG: hypothetical protein IIU83_01670 [Fibrobacteraceae bacterium]|nr:hypothetical protein [Fibrobacteraceae bacterium]